MRALRSGCSVLMLIGVAACDGGTNSALTSPSPVVTSPSPVVSAPVAPAPLPPVHPEDVSLVASPNVVASGDRLTVTWSGPAGRGCSGGGDWIALHKVGDPDNTGSSNGHSDLWFVHLCGATLGTSTLTAPPQAGQYEFRYMAGSESAARSNPITVNASATPAPSPTTPTLTIDGGTESTRRLGEAFWVTGAGFSPGGLVSRYIDPPVNGSGTIAMVTADALGNVSWMFTPTCLTFDPRNTVTIYAVDASTGQRSNTITEKVIGTCP